MAAVAELLVVAVCLMLMVEVFEVLGSWGSLRLSRLVCKCCHDYVLVDIVGVL